MVTEFGAIRVYLNPYVAGIHCRINDAVLTAEVSTSRIRDLDHRLLIIMDMMNNRSCQECDSAFVHRNVLFLTIMYRG